MNQLQIEFIQAMHQFRKIRIDELFPGLNRSEFWALGAIAHCGAGDSRPRVSDIVRRLHNSPQAASRTLRSLEEKGLIQRGTDPEDRRNTLVWLTDQGRETMDVMQKRMENLFEGIFADFGEERMRKLIRELRDLEACGQARFQAVLDEMNEDTERGTK